MLAGCGAGAISAAIANPTDIVLVRMQAGDSGRTYRHMFVPCLVLLFRSDAWI